MYPLTVDNDRCEHAPMAPYLLGVAEIAAMLGVTRQRVNQLIRSQGFPAPEAELSAGRIWRREAVERWVVANPHRATETGDGALGPALEPGARALALRAQEEARDLGHDYVGTEHLLLACLSDAAPDVDRRLGTLGIDRAAVLAEVATRSPAGRGARVGNIPFTPRSIIILATATRLADGPIGPDHVARAVAHVPDGIAAQAMAALSQLTADELVAELDRLLGPDAPEPADDVDRPADDDGPRSRAALADRLDRIADEVHAVRNLLADG
jgi:ATP-dependent Clp protease ATP-binding subunit ClpC